MMLPLRSVGAFRTGNFRGFSLSRSRPFVRRWRDQLAPLTPGQRARAVLPPADRTFVFVCGLHRSGTTLLAKCLGEHPAASSFENTGAIEDEGQFLQSVYPIARHYGGVGRFGFAPEMHITEGSPLVSSANKRVLYTEWRRYWDLNSEVLIEKSPPNLLKTRFLATMFPQTRFVVLLRHPIATSMATKKGSHSSLASLIRHWVTCHEVLLEDLAHVQHVCFLRYEDFVARTDGELGRIESFLGLQPNPRGVQLNTGLNEAYFERWSAVGRYPVAGRYISKIVKRYEARVNRFGYSLRNPHHYYGGEMDFGSSCDVGQGSQD